MPEPLFNIWPAVLSGETADVYFPRTVEVLRKAGINPVVDMEFFPSRAGVLCGISEAKALLEQARQREHPRPFEAWGLGEGEWVERKEVALRIHAPYCSFGVYETALCGILSHCTAWATAARECVEAAAGIPVISFGARHVHPNVAPIMDYAATVGGCTSVSSILGARLVGVAPAGTMPHAFILCVGDTVRAVELFDQHMPSEVPRIALVDTFKDEVEESLRVAQALGKRLQGVRLDTPVERGRVTPELVKEVRAHLDLAGFGHVGVFISGGLTLERIRAFVQAGCPITGFGVGSHISSASPNDFTADIHQVEGRPVAKRGRTPGLTTSPRLRRIL